MIRRSVLLLAGAALACGLSAAPAVSAGTHHEILMRGNSFTPRTITITVGDTVVWRNVDIVRHNAMRAEAFDTGELRGGQSYSWVATDTGEVRYRCTIHQRMRGTLTVLLKP